MSLHHFLCIQRCATGRLAQRFVQLRAPVNSKLTVDVSARRRPKTNRRDASSTAARTSRVATHLCTYKAPTYSFLARARTYGAFCWCRAMGQIGRSLRRQGGPSLVLQRVACESGTVPPARALQRAVYRLQRAKPSAGDPPSDEWCWGTSLCSASDRVQEDPLDGEKHARSWSSFYDAAAAVWSSRSRRRCASRSCPPLKNGYSGINRAVRGGRAGACSDARRGVLGHGSLEEVSL